MGTGPPEAAAPYLETERVVLRRFTPDDLEHIVGLDGDPEVMRHLDGGAPVDRARLADTLAWWIGYYPRFPGFGFWAAEDRTDGRFLGWFHLRPRVDAPVGEPELGYRLRRDAWGRGYATEVSAALVRRAFAELGATRVWASTMAANTASRRVMEKVGLRLVREYGFDGPVGVPGADAGVVEYSLTRVEWLAGTVGG